MVTAEVSARLSWLTSEPTAYWSGGDKTDRLRLRTLIAHLDTPLEDGGDTRVRYLRYADALDLATKLESQYNGPAAPEGGGPAAARDITIWADEQTNALVITAPPESYAFDDDDHRQNRYPSCARFWSKR